MYNCYDCDKEIKMKEDSLIGAKQLLYKDKAMGDLVAFKCDECFAKDTSLHDFRETEVYSRVVGYLRPVKQWNKGKKQEYADRKNYKL